MFARFTQVHSGNGEKTQIQEDLNPELENTESDSDTDEEEQESL